MDKARSVTALFRDAQPPRIQIESPLGAITHDERFTLSGSVTDNIAVASVCWLWNGQLVANRTSDLAAEDGSDAIPLIAAAALHSGDCELRITALQGGDSSTQSLRYTIPAQ